MPILYIKVNNTFIPIKTIKGKDGKSAYECAVEGGFIGTYEEFCQAIAELMPNTEHTLNQKNPHAVTAEQVGSLKIYSGFSVINAELGKEFNSDTPLADIIKAMPDNTGLVADIREPKTGEYPTQYGTLTIYKIREQRVTVMYKDWSAYILWLGDYTVENGFKGFKRIITDNSEHPLTFDKADLGVPIVMKNGNSYYAMEKHRLVNTRPCKMDVGLGIDPSAVLQLFIGDENAEKVPDQYTHRLALRFDGLEFSKRNEDNTVSKFRIHGEHNKPSSTYTGTYESANPKTQIVNIGGTGKLLLIVGGQAAYIASPTGIAALGEGGNWQTTGRFEGGTLYLNGVIANVKGIEYTYQVL